MKGCIRISGWSWVLWNVRFGADILGFTDRYLEQLKHSKVKGYLFQQQNYVPKE
jgi:hypothetical protein